MNESALLIKTAFQNDSVKMGIESKEIARRLKSQNSSGLDLLAHSRGYGANLPRLPRQLRILGLSLPNASFNFGYHSLNIC